MLETKTTEQAIALIEEAEEERELFLKDRGEIKQRLDDVTKILRQIKIKEEKLDSTHNAIDTRMEKMDRMIVNLEFEKTGLVRWRQELQKHQDLNSKQTKKLEKSQAAFQKQSDQLAQLMRQQQETKLVLDTREEKLESREEALALRELAVKKGEVAMIHREQALKAYEQEVQKQISIYLQNESALQDRMNSVMNDAMEHTLVNLSPEFSTPYIPGTATQVTISPRATACYGTNAYSSVE